ncbi:hypothetical protein JTE90_006007, partial [Oedothorax gibbosus]
MAAPLPPPYPGFRPDLAGGQSNQQFGYPGQQFPPMGQQFPPMGQQFPPAGPQFPPLGQQFQPAGAQPYPTQQFVSQPQGQAGYAPKPQFAGQGYPDPGAGLFNVDGAAVVLFAVISLFVF